MTVEPNQAGVDSFDALFKKFGENQEQQVQDDQLPCSLRRFSPDLPSELSRAPSARTLRGCGRRKSVEASEDGHQPPCQVTSCSRGRIDLCLLEGRRRCYKQAQYLTARPVERLRCTSRAEDPRAHCDQAAHFSARELSRRAPLVARQASPWQLCAIAFVLAHTRVPSST